MVLMHVGLMNEYQGHEHKILAGGFRMGREKRLWP